MTWKGCVNVCAVSYEKQNQIATITIQHPPMNALSRVILCDLNNCLDQIESDQDIKVLVIQGGGDHFSAGADIKEFMTMGDEAAYQKLSEQALKVFDRIENFSIPVIAAIHGAALGGGLELAMACHMRIVTKHATLGLPEINLGLIPGYGGTRRLPLLVGFPKASEMILTGETVNGEKAERLGLANQAVEETHLYRETLALAEKIAQKSKPAIESALQLLSTQKSRHEQDREFEAQAFAHMFESEDSKEGLNAFLEKRSPVFRDR